MSEISSITLFHFTEGLDKLQSILSTGIKSSLVSEKISGRNLAYFSDMICFCDIPLSKVKEHVNWYGEYAIGIRPETLKKAGATPVIYTHSKTPFLVKGENKRACQEFKKLPVLQYLKRCSGRQYKKHTNQFSSKRFIEEREWRIINGNSADVIKFQNLGELKTLTDQEKRRTHNPLIVKFDTDDIEYIIVSTRKEIPIMADWLKISFPSDYQSYLPKLLAYTQISRDF